MFVKVGKMPGKVEDLAVESGTTVSEALECVGLTTDGYQVRKNGEQVDLSATLRDGDVVLLTKMIKGNTGILVKVGKMPGKVEDLAVEPGSTVGELIKCAELETDGYQIRKNGEVAGMEDRVRDGDVVLLTKMIKGNR